MVDNIMDTILNDDEINELAKMIADVTLTEAIDSEYEDMLDTMFAEHQAMLYAAQSYDLDAQAYGEM
jgi:hypothetical protein